MGLLDRAISRLLPLVPRPIVRRVAGRYIAGTTVADAFTVVRDLLRQGAMATLDILGEFVQRPEEAEANSRAYRDLVRRIAEDGLPQTNVSVKLTALGLLLDEDLCQRNVRALMETVAAHNTFVRLDMEDSRCTEGTLRIYETLREEFPGRIGVALQARLKRTLEDARRLAARPSNFRLCKGIYLEPPAIAYQDREEIRRSFLQTLEAMLERQAYVGIATHDPVLVEGSLERVARYGRAREEYEFQTLLGVAEPLRRSLIAAGHRLRVYVPFGEQWYGYTLRRLRENPQIAGYVFRALFSRR